MKHLGILQGMGRLFDGGTDHGEAGYQIDVFEDHGLRHGRGSLDIAFREVVPLMRDSLTLQLRDGANVTIAISQASSSSGVTFVTSGPIPGF